MIKYQNLNSMDAYTENYNKEINATRIPVNGRFIFLSTLKNKKINLAVCMGRSETEI